MPGIHTQTEILASPERCWEVLVDFPRYPEWNPFLIRIERQPPDRIRLKVKSGLLTVSFNTKLLVKEAPKELRWRGNFLSDGVVAGEHYFRLEPQAGGKTMFVHGEDFTGAISSVAWAVMRPGAERGYAKMNAAFKARCETKERG